MNYSNIDSLVRRTLLERGLPIHYYFEYLIHAASCLRELHLSKLKNINSCRLVLNEYSAADLPGDFVDDVAVTIPVGNFLKPVARMEGISPLRSLNQTTGNYQTYTDGSSTTSNSLFGFPFGWAWYWNVNEYGESMGRSYGSSGGANSSGYKIVRERRQIQFSETFASPQAILLYISDGQSIDNATQIDVRATATIQAYIAWKNSPNRDNERSPEAQAYYNQARTLVARLDEITIPDLKDILYKNYRASAKN